MAVRSYVRKKDGATVYCAIFRGPDGEQRVRFVRAVKADAPQREHARARTAAEKYAQDQRIDVENARAAGVEWDDPRRAEQERALSFHGLIASFLRNYQSRSGSMDYYTQRADVWKRLIPNKAAAAVATTDGDAFLRARLAEVSDETARKDLVGLSAMFRWAVARKMLKFNPFDSSLVRRPAKSRPDPNPYTHDEEARLLAALDPDYRPIVEFALLTGADRAEVVTLTWARIDLERQVIKLPRSKTGVPRAIPYAGRARLRDLIESALARRGESPRVFLRHDGQPITVEGAKTAMRRAQARAKIGKGRPWKTLRATFATRLLEDKVDAATIAELMGLTTSHVLSHYLKPAGLHLENAMRDPTPKPRRRKGRRA